MEKYAFNYQNENEFKKLEKALKKYNIFVFKKLYFEYYPKIKAGEFLGTVVADDGNVRKYEVNLPTDALFAKVHGIVKLHYEVNDDSKSITLITLSPEDILSEVNQSELVTYKGVMFSKEHSDIAKIKNRFT